MAPILNGIDLAPAHRRWRFWIAEGRDELPEFRASSEVIPFRRGQLRKPGLANKRSLELRGYIQDATDAAMQVQIDALKLALDPERATPCLIEDVFADGSPRWITAVPLNVLPRYGGKATRLMSIALESFDPYWYRTWAAWTLDSGLWLDSGVTLDSGATIVISPTALTFDTSFGTLSTADVTKVRLELDGPSSTAIEVTNQSIEGAPGFGHPTLLAGQTLIVDAGLRTVTLAGVYDRAALTLGAANSHGEYFRLTPGINAIRITGQPTQVRVSFPATYL